MKNFSNAKPLTLGAGINQLLAQYGVNVVFGIPGVHNIELFRGVENSGIDLVLPRHEQGAGFMADGYARASGKPGVCFVTSGPGLTNIMTPMGQAYSDSVPMLVISSVLPRKDNKKGKGIIHEMRDQEAAAATVSCLSVTVDTDADISQFIGRAFSLFRVCRPRPVHLQVPTDLLNNKGRTLTKIKLPERPHPYPESIKKAVAILNESNRPMIIAGGGASQCGSEVQSIAEQLNAAVITTIAGKGTVPDDNPRCLGAVLPRKAVHKFLNSADTVLVVGSEMALKDFQCASLPITGRFVRIDLDPNVLAGSVPVDLPILSDACLALTAIQAKLRASRSGIEINELDQLRQTIRAEVRSQFPGNYSFIQELRKALPDDAIISADMTEPAYSANELFPMRHPFSWLHPVGFGSLGYALPAAIGAKIAAPKRPVVALIGDYGLQFTLSEISVAVERKLALPIIVWNNEKLWAIEHVMVDRKMAITHSQCKNPDFQEMARAFGAHATMPKSLMEIEEIIGKSLKRKGPTVIEIRPDHIN